MRVATFGLLICGLGLILAHRLRYPIVLSWRWFIVSVLVGLAWLLIVVRGVGIRARAIIGTQ